MKITAVEAIPFAIPYLKPLKFASGEVSTAEHVLVRVHTTDGVVGVAEAPPRPFTYGETQAGVVAVIDQIFGPAVVGLDLTQHEQVHERLRRTIGNPAAKSSIDMAIWDALGKTRGLSVTDRLGGWTDRMQVSHMLGFDEPAAAVAEAVKMRAVHGITTFKVKVGRRPVSLDTAVVRALREGLGSEVELYVDGNRGWSASESARAMREMADLGLTFAEELNDAADVMGRRWLVGQLDIAFIADESVPTPADVTREVLAGSATAISIKTARTTCRCCWSAPPWEQARPTSGLWRLLHWAASSRSSAGICRDTVAIVAITSNRSPWPSWPSGCSRRPRSYSMSRVGVAGPSATPATRSVGRSGSNCCSTTPTGSGPPYWCARPLSSATTRCGATGQHSYAAKAPPPSWRQPRIAGSPPASCRNIQIAEALLGDLAATDAEGYALVCEALADFDVSGRLVEIKAPVLAVAGAHDVASPVESLTAIADTVGDGRLVVLDGVAHLAPTEAPNRVAALLREHLTRPHHRSISDD